MVTASEQYVSLPYYSTLALITLPTTRQNRWISVKSDSLIYALLYVLQEIL